MTPRASQPTPDECLRVIDAWVEEVVADHGGAVTADEIYSDIVHAYLDSEIGNNRKLRAAVLHRTGVSERPHGEVRDTGDGQCSACRWSCDVSGTPCHYAKECAWCGVPSLDDLCPECRAAEAAEQNVTGL